MGFHMISRLIDSDHHATASAPVTETLDKICQLPCDQSSNETAFCLAPCSADAICPGICNDDLSSLRPPPASASRSSFHPNKLFLASFSLIALALIALFCYAIYYWRFRRPRRPEVAETREEFLDEDHGPAIDHPIWYINTVGLPAAVIESIAVFKYRKGDGLVDGSDCSVCLSEFQEDETLRLLPKCSHAFHISCIDKWLRSHTNCPMCRAPIAAARPSGPGESSRSPETRVDIPQQNEQVNVQSPGSDNGGGERRAASLDSSEAAKMGVFASGSSEDSNPDPKRVGRSQSLLRFVGSSLQSGPVFLKRSVSCYGDLSPPAAKAESGSSPSL